jgi:pimeloyl-ACP methyl ester carboxylesterase
MCYSNPSHPTDAAIEQYLRPLVASAERKVLVNRYLVALEANPLEGLESALAASKVPTRIVWGMKDTMFSAGNVEYLARILPRLTGILRIPEGKLFFPEEVPNVIAQEARVLWKQTGTLRVD